MSNKRELLLIQISPKGKISLSLKNNENQIIESFNAKEIEGNLDWLLYRESLNKKSKIYEDIVNTEDFSALFLNKYNWILKTEIEDDESLNDFSVYSFLYQPIDFSQNKVQNMKPIPDHISLKWGNKQEYGIQFSFNSFEILNAYRILNDIKGNQSIIMTFYLYKNKFPVCKISKNEKVIILRDLYPELPIRYAN